MKDHLLCCQTVLGLAVTRTNYRFELITFLLVVCYCSKEGVGGFSKLLSDPDYPDSNPLFTKVFLEQNFACKGDAIAVSLFNCNHNQKVILAIKEFMDYYDFIGGSANELE